MSSINPSENSFKKEPGKQRFRKAFAIIIATSFTIGGCAEFGGRDLTLLTSSAVLDPLEVPPGLSSLPETSQFRVPRELDPSERLIDEIPREQFRNYESWVKFEQFYEFYAKDQGFDVSAEEYNEARRKGSGIFKVVTKRTDEGTARMRVFDDINSVWNNLSVVLLDMGVEIEDTDREDWTFDVKNIEIEELPTLFERMGLREYTGAIERLRLVAVGDSTTEVLGLTVDDDEVNFTAGEPFFKRLRLYLLTQYEADDSPFAQEPALAGAPAKKELVNDQGGKKIVVRERFDFTWERVGKTLRASGMDIVDINRNKGIFYVSFHSSKPKKKKRWKFWKKDASIRIEEQYQVVIKGTGNHSEIYVVTASSSEGGILEPDDVLALLYERLTI